MHLEWINLISYLICFQEDLSYNKSVTQMHFYSHLPQYAPKNAVDRNIETCMRTNDTGKNSQFKTVWWKVDLGDVYSIYNINILFKNYENEGTYFITNIDTKTKLKYISYVITCIIHSKLTIIRNLVLLWICYSVRFFGSITFQFRWRFFHADVKFISTLLWINCAQLKIKKKVYSIIR